MALPPVNPHLPSATQIKTHPILPREDCELLRFRQFECDVMPDYKATCYSVWREFLR